MKKLTYLTIFITGLLLGTLLSYFTLQKIIASRGGMGMNGFVDTAHTILNRPEVMDMLICSKLAMSKGYKIDNPGLNLMLNEQLKPIDNGEMRAFFVLIYVKGYAFGIADSIADKATAFDQYRCDSQYPWLLKEG
ncbi:conserved hypothetical protein [Shewanella sediminis HAW-EB3]|uniref:Uncharacterized protein n=1 Tax=Shewanella sediminis (strain HAW-EB3) TaxID=425104 RepID=A8G087_SHESH|nr:hypothetical protein [Shewanella sediminis]ABV38510.1 conserved hypothetical protein [Shewanella sediminis HAW-EB3]